ncbi:Coenzyme PQQ synthesis protein D (PqqD) [Cetobacterium ceti]|uniref:Coenzyme PQQ synthesis protein D (PqqD) n=1 Tax=Cetobacterium ceti TaxID=180163 RepID=A0A1T4N6L6_9FUSO|nr:PqqD family protein [Cetobacterium ceti]SJZ74755.1 Coenzyme PQQ synthesis protein D (PqqD) [Cetobacterium ceti]
MNNKEDFLQYKPVHILENFYVENDKVVLVYTYNTRWSTFMKWLTKKPKTKYMHLDELGTYFWLNCNKDKTIENIIDEMAIKFKDSKKSMETRIFQYASYLAKEKYIGFI